MKLRPSGRWAWYVWVGVGLCTHMLSGMVYDSNVLPLYQKMLFRNAGGSGQLLLQPLMFVADQALLDDPHEDQVSLQAVFRSDIPLFQYQGNYLQRAIARAAVSAGKLAAPPFRSDLLAGGTLSWAMDGIIRGQGLGCTFWQPITSLFSWGFDFFIARVTSALSLVEDPLSFADIPAGDRQELFTSNVQIAQSLGIQSVLSQSIGMSDTNLYMRVGWVGDYCLRMRHIDVGGQIGLIIPTSNTKRLDNPASISLGGSSGRWGIFVTGEGQFEVKKGLTVQALLRVNKRFSYEPNLRVPVNKEPTTYGADIGRFLVDPGVTVAAQLGMQLARLRSGFGIYGAYLLAAHQDDKIMATGSFNAPPELSVAQHRSGWACEYVTATVCYDIGADNRKHTFSPIITFNVDIPVSFLIARRNVQTYGISLTVESTLW